MYNKSVLISGFYIVLYRANKAAEEYVLKCKVSLNKNQQCYSIYILNGIRQQALSLYDSQSKHGFSVIIYPSIISSLFEKIGSMLYPF